MTGAVPQPRPFSFPRLVPVALLLLAALPVGFIALQAIAASRNIVFWDEFDTALDLILRLHAGAGWNEILERFFAIDNEHRIFTSRLLFATSYWLTGTVNFHVIGAIGNLCLVGACTVLVVSVQTTARRVRLGVVLAFVLFQLENFENFLWSGASIDHFQIVLLAFGALAALARNTRAGVYGAGLLALLATFTLAHGCLVWPVGALLLARERRWRHLAFWGGLALLVIGAFLHGFQVNPGHRIADFSAASLGRIAHYWLALLGGPLSFGHAAPAPALGLLLLVTLGGLGAGGAAQRERVVFPCALFAVSALGLIALGRTDVSGGQLLSRYLILGALAWALTAFLLLERWSAAGRPFRLLLWCLPALAAFNLAANAQFGPLAEGFAEARDRAALRYKQYGGVDGHGQQRLHPKDGHAQILLSRAREQGVYRLPLLCVPTTFPQAQPSTRIISHIDERTIGTKTVYLGGWAMIPDQVSRRGQIHVVLRSKSSQHIFTTVTLQRPDVAQAYHEPRWRLSGFRFVAGRDRLPAEDFQVGLLITTGAKAEFVMTDQWLRLTDPAAAEPWLANDS